MPRASFVRNVGILGGGTALAQALSVLVLPIITRLYTPEDFSVLAVYSALLSMIAVVACLRFEIAIPLPKDDLEAANLMVLGLFFSTFISVNVALLVWLFPGHIAKGLGQPALQPYLWLLPAGVWLSGIYACAQYWATRTKRFTAIAQTRLTRSLGSVIIQIAMGWVTQTAPLGLLLGQLAGAGTGILKLGKVALVDIQPLKKSINRFTLQSAFKKYSRLPKY